MTSRQHTILLALLLTGCSEYDLQKELEDTTPPGDTATFDTAVFDTSEPEPEPEPEPETINESCNGLDDDGDGLVDEGFTDTDGDGIADCVDEEECDGLDNDGDGQVDEGFDADEDFTPDCQESTYEITWTTTGDDIWEGWVDGVEHGSFGGWSTVDNLSFTLNSGRHVLAVHGYDTGQTIVGFLSEVVRDGEPLVLTGDGAWVGVATAPSGDWTSVDYDDSSWTRAIPCSNTSPWGGQPTELLDRGARWVWSHPYGDCEAISDGWFRLTLNLP